MNRERPHSLVFPTLPRVFYIERIPATFTYNETHQLISDHMYDNSQLYRDVQLRFDLNRPDGNSSVSGYTVQLLGSGLSEEMITLIRQDMDLLLKIKI
jgi:hypothetical protein